MSTKIYNGFRFVPGTTLNDIYRYVAEFRKELQPLAEEKISREIVERAIRYLDLQSLGLDESGEQGSPLFRAHTGVTEEERNIATEPYRNHPLDMKFEITIHLAGDKILGMHWTSQRDFQDLWMAKPFILDYHYQNQTDPPDEVPEDEWQEREHDWCGIVFPGFESPTMSGLMAVCCPSIVYDYGMDDARIQELLPSFDLRLQNVVDEIILWRQYLKNRAETITPGDTFRLYLEYKEWLKAGGADARAEAGAEAGPKLIWKPTKEDLLRKHVTNS
jgi:hypothetical protein